MSETPPAFWVPLLWRALAAFGLAAPGVALNVWERSLDSETRFSPGLLELQQNLHALPMLSFVLAVVLVIRRYSASTRAFTIVQRVAWVAVVVLAQVLAVAVAVGVGIGTKPNWLFGPGQPDFSLRSPNGQRTAHATSSCILNFCSLDVQVQEGSQLTMRRLRNFPRWKREALYWLPDSSDVRLAGDDVGAKP